MTINEMLDSLKSKVQALMTNESSKEFIDSVSAISSDIDSAKEQAEKDKKELSDMKDLYIKAVRKEGSTTPPKEDSGKQEPKSFAEFCQSELDKSQKK